MASQHHYLAIHEYRPYMSNRPGNFIVHNNRLFTEKTSESNDEKDNIILDHHRHYRPIALIHASGRHPGIFRSIPTLNTTIVMAAAKPYRNFYHSTKRQNDTYYSLIYTEKHDDYRVNTYNGSLMKIKKDDRLKITYADTMIGRYAVNLKDLSRDKIDLRIKYFTLHIY